MKNKLSQPADQLYGLKAKTKQNESTAKSIWSIRSTRNYIKFEVHIMFGPKATIFLGVS